MGSEAFLKQNLDCMQLATNRFSYTDARGFRLSVIMLLDVISESVLYISEATSGCRYEMLPGTPSGRTMHELEKKIN
jgi:hypothetical protein